MDNKVVFYPKDNEIIEISNVTDVIIHDNYIRVRYKTEKGSASLSSNLPFIYYDGEN